MPISDQDRIALDTLMSSDMARLVSLQRGARALRAAVASLTGAQRTTLQSLGGGSVWVALQDCNASLDMPAGVRLVAVPAARWLARERLAEALQRLAADHPEIAEALAALQAAGGTPGQVDPAPANEAAIE